MGSADTSSTVDLRDAFDYVIVGGGTAGLVVANRLTEDPRFNVLVLEAGENRVDDPRIKIPGLATSTYFDPEFDWCISSVPQEHLNDRVIAEPRGRTLGGSSAINLGMVIYPGKADFEGWEQLGNAGWNWDSLSQYLRKSLTFTLPKPEIQDQLSLQYIDESIHGSDGPVQVSFGDGPFPAFNSAWPKVFENLTGKLTGDPMSGVARGPFCNPGTIDPKTGTRSHANVAYYNSEVAKRPNLRVITEAMVERILLEKFDGAIKATGVVFKGKDGVQRTITATTEVILAAGAIKTPHLLELSGIGDSKLLQSHGINVVIENPNVGNNLQEHCFVPFGWEIADDQQSGDAMRIPEAAQAAMTAWEQNSGAGPLGQCAITSAYMTPPELQSGEIKKLASQYLDNFKYSTFPAQDVQYGILRQLLENENEPIGQFTMAPFQVTPEKGPSPKGIYAMTEPGNYITIVAVLNRPFSRGNVHLTSEDPYENPIFDPKFLSHPLDVELHFHMVNWLETLAWTEPMASLLKKNGRRLHREEVNDLDTARRLTRDRIVAHYHVSGTAAMMPREYGGVVDDKLRVYGTTNSRVVDASIFPLIPRGNIQTSVFAVAEKAADIIKKDWKSESNS